MWKGVIDFGDYAMKSVGPSSKFEFQNDPLKTQDLLSLDNNNPVIRKGGVFHRDKLHLGKGKKRRAFGDEESGYFENDELAGNGSRVFFNQRVEKGYFKHGKLHGQATRLFGNGDLEDGAFDNGTLIQGTKTISDLNGQRVIDVDETKCSKDDETESALQLTKKESEYLKQATGKEKRNIEVAMSSVGAEAVKAAQRLAKSLY